MQGEAEGTSHEAESAFRGQPVQAISLPSEKNAKTVLRLPDLEYAKAAVLNSLISPDAHGLLRLVLTAGAIPIETPNEAQDISSDPARNASNY